MISADRLERTAGGPFQIRDRVAGGTAKLFHPELDGRTLEEDGPERVARAVMVEMIEVGFCR